MSDARA